MEENVRGWFIMAEGIFNEDSVKSVLNGLDINFSGTVIEIEEVIENGKVSGVEIINCDGYKVNIPLIPNDHDVTVDVEKDPDNHYYWSILKQDEDDLWITEYFGFGVSPEDCFGQIKEMHDGYKSLLDSINEDKNNGHVFFRSSWTLKEKEKFLDFLKEIPAKPFSTDGYGYEIDNLKVSRRRH